MFPLIRATGLTPVQLKALERLPLWDWADVGFSLFGLKVISSLEWWMLDSELPC